MNCCANVRAAFITAVTAFFTGGFLDQQFLCLTNNMVVVGLAVFCSRWAGWDCKPSVHSSFLDTYLPSSLTLSNHFIRWLIKSSPIMHREWKVRGASVFPSGWGSVRQVCSVHSFCNSAPLTGQSSFNLCSIFPCLRLPIYLFVRAAQQNESVYLS